MKKEVEKRRAKAGSEPAKTDFQDTPCPKVTFSLGVPVLDKSKRTYWYPTSYITLQPGPVLKPGDDSASEPSNYGSGDDSNSEPSNYDIGDVTGSVLNNYDVGDVPGSVLGNCDGGNVTPSMLSNHESSKSSSFAPGYREAGDVSMTVPNYHGAGDISTSLPSFQGHGDISSRSRKTSNISIASSLGSESDFTDMAAERKVDLNGLIEGVGTLIIPSVSIGSLPFKTLPSQCVL